MLSILQIRKCLPLRMALHSTHFKFYYGMVLDLNRPLTDDEFNQIRDYWRER